MSAKECVLVSVATPNSGCVNSPSFSGVEGQQPYRYVGISIWKRNTIVNINGNFNNIILVQKMGNRSILSSLLGIIVIEPDNPLLQP